MVQQFQAWLQSMGLDEAGSSAVAQQANPSAALDWAESLLAALVNALGNGVTMAMIMIFMFVDVILFPGRLAWQGQHRSSYAKRVATYAVSICASISSSWSSWARAVGIANTIFFYIMGVPRPALWGVLSGILNFIPFIGFWLRPDSARRADAAAVRLGAHADCAGWLHSDQRHRPERRPTQAGRVALQPHAADEPVLLYLLAAGAGARRCHHRRAADHVRALTAAGRRPQHALAGRHDVHDHPRRHRKTSPKKPPSKLPPPGISAVATCPGRH